MPEITLDDVLPLVAQLSPADQREGAPPSRFVLSTKVCEVKPISGLCFCAQNIF